MLEVIEHKPLLRIKVLKDMDTLIHDKQKGFYDASLDLYFSDLNFWSKIKWGITLKDIHL